jgi:SulP family sulfate permease
MPLGLFPSLSGYGRSWLRGDLIAGLTVWAVLVPEALAYASIAGVSPVVGLYAAPAALLFYAVFGSSRQLIVGPMSATAALSAATVGDLVTHGAGDFAAMTATLAIAAGLAALIAGILRLGFLASYISEPVIKGFIVGLALTIIIGQVPDLLGIPKVSGEFFEKCWGVISHLGDVQGTTALVGIGSLTLILALKRFVPAVPGSLVAVGIGILLVELFSLNDDGVAIVGQIKAGLPSIGLPDVSASRFGDLVAGGVAVMFVGFAEGLGAAKTYAAKKHQDIDTNRELLGLGTANLGAGLCSGMVVNGSLSKTAVNGGAGANSQLSGLLVAVLTILTLLFLTGLFEHLPLATLAAVVIAAVIELVDVPSLRRLFDLPSQRARASFGVAARPDFIAAMVALFGVLIFDTLPGLFLGIFVSLMLLLYRSSRPNVATLGQLPDGRFADLQREPEAKELDGIVVLRAESGLYFANADAVRDAVRRRARQDGVRAVILDAESVPYLDVTAATALQQLDEELTAAGQRFLIARDVGQVRDVLRRADAGDPNLSLPYPTVRAAVAALAEKPRADGPVA